MDSAWEQRKLEARKILENAAESPQVAFSQWLGSFSMNLLSMIILTFQTMLWIA